MIFPRPPKIFFITLFLVFFIHTVFAYYFNWDFYLYKRMQDILVITIGITVWVLTLRKILEKKNEIVYFVALSALTIIITIHVLRALNGGLLC